MTNRNAAADAMDPHALVADADPGDVDAVLATMDAYLIALEQGDVEAMAALRTPEGTTFRIDVSKGAASDPMIRSSTGQAVAARHDGRRLRERYWSPVVRVRGPIATLWAPYRFWVDDAPSHAGVNAFQFLRSDGRWRISNASWTVEPADCADLQPPADAALRPAL